MGSSASSSSSADEKTRGIANNNLSSSPPSATGGQKETILVVGGTGRTGSHLVRRLCDDETSRFRVAVLARDPAKASLLKETSWKGCDDIAVIQGDLGDVKAWEHHLRGEGVSQIATAVSCGVRLFSNPLGILLPPSVADLLGATPQSNLPRAIDYAGMEALCAAARAADVKRLVCVTTASTGTPFSAAAIFLNSVAAMSVKNKFLGEQAVRRSGLDYVIVRPFGLQDTAAPLGGDTGLGIDWTQGRTEGTRKRIPRADVAAICHEALSLPHSSSSSGSGSSGSISINISGDSISIRSNGSDAVRTTFECWATPDHDRRVPWGDLRQEPPGSVADVDHDTAVAMGLGVVGAVCVGLGKGTGALARHLFRAVK